MRPHTRHVVVATVIALIVLVIARVAARAEDFSTYSGAKLYARFCASCHGLEGHGDGRVASSFRIMVPDLTRIARRQGGTFPELQIRRIIDGRTVLPPHGSREMPVWGLEFDSQNSDKSPSQHSTEQMVSRLTDYIRAMQTE